MSKLSKDVLLEQIDTWINSCKYEGIKIHGNCKKCICGEICKQAEQQIKEMIQKPEVTEEWILEWERRLTHYAIGLTYKEANREIRTMLKEIGVRVA